MYIHKIYGSPFVDFNSLWNPSSPFPQKSHVDDTEETALETESASSPGDATQEQMEEVQQKYGEGA